MKEKGQALIEMALILPFLLVLIVGIVEMGVVLNRQLTVINAAREGARFGAYGADPNAIYAQTLLATSRMFEFTEENAVVAVIHAETNEDGDGFEEWTIFPEDDDAPHVTSEGILANLREEGGCDAGDELPCPMAAALSLIIVDVRYDHKSVLGLPVLGDLFGLVPIGSWTVMRVHG